MIPITAPGSVSIPGLSATSPAQAGAANGFVQLIEGLISSANTQGITADQAVRDLASGQTDNLHNVLLEVAKADISFRLVLEIRNRLSEAFQEIMRMSV
jgi:flagellar hook-basal body complex protein FliE